MKKLVFAMMAVFAMVSCGGGIAEKTAAIEEEMNEKLKAAFEDKDSEAVVEAYEWYYGEMTDLMEDTKEFTDKEKEIKKTRRAIEKDLREAKLPTNTDKEKIEKVKEEYLKKVVKLAEGEEE